MKLLHRFTVFILPAFYMLSCVGCKREVITNYYADTESPQLAILSNKGNNLMTCFMDGLPWRTMDRITGFNPQTELEIRRMHTGGTQDTITIKWAANDSPYDIQLSLPVAKNFEWKDFSEFAGKRIIIDSSNGYFSLMQNSYYNAGNGKGTIYFNTAYIDSTSPTHIIGRISGLLEASIYTLTITPKVVNITSGRFDDDVTGVELHGY